MSIAIINPATGETEKEFEAHDAAEVERRIAAAQSAYQAMKKTTFAQRAAWMNRAADLLEAELEETATTMVREMGKPIAAARAEVDTLYARWAELEALR